MVLRQELIDRRGLSRGVLGALVGPRGLDLELREPRLAEAKVDVGLDADLDDRIDDAGLALPERHLGVEPIWPALVLGAVDPLLELVEPTVARAHVGQRCLVGLLQTLELRVRVRHRPEVTWRAVDALPN